MSEYELMFAIHNWSFRQLMKDAKTEAERKRLKRWNERERKRFSKVMCDDLQKGSDFLETLLKP